MVILLITFYSIQKETGDNLTWISWRKDKKNENAKNEYYILKNLSPI